MSPAIALAGSLRGAGLDITEDRSRCQVASRDHSWLSPVLVARLPKEPAAVVAFPHDVEQLATAVSLAHGHQVPVTLRGRGTGNYGQAVPLAGGLVIDICGLDRAPQIADGWARVEPGVACSEIERVARASDQELAIFPSTTHSTIGGFLAGGAGGSGSIEHGFVWDGFVGAAEILDCSDEPAVTEVSGEAVRPFLHAYGTTGILVSSRVCLQPARSWSGLCASFDDVASGAAAGLELLGGVSVLRLLGVTDAELVADLGTRPYLPLGRASLRAVVQAAHVGEVDDRIRAAGGRVDASGPHLVAAVTALSYNHVTLRAKRKDQGVCHLQVGGPALVSRADEVRRCLPEGRLHLDAMRAGAGAGFGGLLISRFAGEEVLREGMAAVRALGVHVVDPHTWMVADDDGSRAATARCVDPAGLLNPGKLAR